MPGGRIWLAGCLALQPGPSDAVERLLGAAIAKVMKLGCVCDDQGATAADANSFCDK